MFLFWSWFKWMFKSSHYSIHSERILLGHRRFPSHLPIRPLPLQLHPLSRNPPTLSTIPTPVVKPRIHQNLHLLFGQIQHLQERQLQVVGVHNLYLWIPIEVLVQVRRRVQVVAGVKRKFRIRVMAVVIRWWGIRMMCLGWSRIDCLVGVIWCNGIKGSLIPHLQLFSYKVAEPIDSWLEGGGISGLTGNFLEMYTGSILSRFQDQSSNLSWDRVKSNNELGISSCLALHYLRCSILSWSPIFSKLYWNY